MGLSREGWGRIIALIAAADGDLTGAEDALSSALERAVTVWRDQGVPSNPEGWLYRVALNARRDVWRSAAVRTSVAWDPEDHDCPDSRLHDGADPRVLGDSSPAPGSGDLSDPDALPDRRLELLAACAHPDIEPSTRALLMLSAVMGLTGRQIAAGMALPAATVSARLTRAKKRIASLGIAFGLPDRTELEARLPDIHEAIYGAFAIDWVHAAPEPREGIVGEALYLSRLLAELNPNDGESHGLAALIHLSAARFPGRRSPEGNFVPLDEQDPDTWDEALITRGEHHLRMVHRSKEIGRFGLQAAIQVLHMAGVRSGETDWPMLLRLSNDLEAIAPSLGGSVARAAVIAEIDGPAAGLAALDALPGLNDAFTSKRIAAFQPAWALRAHLSEQLGRGEEAERAYRRAIDLTTNPAERAYLGAKARR